MYRKCQNRLTYNARTVEVQVLNLELKSLVYGEHNAKNRHVVIGILPPICRNYKSGNGCIHGHRCLYRHADGEEKPSKRSKKEGTQGAVAILKENKVQGCVSHNSDPKKSIYSTECWRIEIERFVGTHLKILRKHLVPNSKSGKKRAIWRSYPKM